MSLSCFVAALRRPGWWEASPWGRWAGKIVLGLLAAAWVLGLSAWLLLHWWILPRLDEWRPRVEAQAARALGHPVQIGAITVQSSGWVPAFTLRDVVLKDAQGREALRLPQVSAALSVPALLALQLRFEQLLIEQPRLEVRRDAAGRWHVAGLDVAAAESSVDGGAAADWFFEQHEFVIRGGLLRWVDEQRAAPPLQLADVQLVLRNRGRRHELRLDATPPADWGERFTLIAQARSPLLARAGDWQRWKGTLHADLPRADVAQLRRHVDLPADLRSGEAALRTWVDWDRGQPLALTVDAALRDVSVRLGPDLEPLALAALAGRFVAERQGGGVALAVQRLAFSMPDGRAWAPSQLALKWQPPPALGGDAVSAKAPVGGGEFSADRLDLALLADLGERLPIGAGLRRLLDQLNPEGTVQQLQARWDGPLDAPRHYAASAQVHGLAIAAAPSPEPDGIGRPGWRGADLTISASERGGQAELTVTDGAVEFPGVFEQAAVALAHFNAQLQWRIEPPPAAAAPASAPRAATGALAGVSPASAAATEPPASRIELKVLGARFDNDDAKGTLDATWRTGAGSGFGKDGRLPGVLELSGNLSEGRAVRVARYLPLGIAASVRQWVAAAVQGGELRDVNFRVKGDLWDFPFVNRRDGEFRIAGKVQDVTLAPIPSLPALGDEPAWASPWPAFGALSGELVFERNAMQFQQASGKLWGVDLVGVQGRIRELSDHAVLEIEGQARGPAADLLRYLRVTPIGEWTGDALAQATVSGSAELKLGLNIPLARTADTVAKVAVTLPGNDVRLRPDLPLLANARGRVDATHKGFALVGLRTQVAGGEAQVDGGSQPDGSVRIAAVGNASADGLRRLTELGPVPRIAQRLQGQTAYRLLIGLQHGRTEWQLASTLAGMAIDLPPPLRKPAEGTLALRLGLSEPRGTLAAAEPRANAARDWLRLELGPLQASLLLEHVNGDTRLLRSALAYDSPLPEAVAGGRAVLALPRLDVDAWRALADAPAGAAGGLDAGWLPQQVQLKTPELLASGRRLTGLTLDLQRLATPGDEGWRAQLSADQAAGSVELREPRAAGAAGRIKARLSRLSLPPAEAQTVADSMAGLLEQAPARVPALDIEVEDFELRGHKLGRLAVEAANRGPGGAAGDETSPRSEWRLTRLALANADARLAASGRWRAVAGQAQRHMALDFKLDVDNGGALLERLGFGAVVRGAKGQIQGTLGWDGSPLDFDIPSLSGSLGLALEGGQFLKVDAGAARLLGVLSLQALPRRLLLDFRDVFAEGFAFDNAGGDVTIARGVAHTRNLRFKGLQAVIAMEGSADIGRETQDLHVVALPELNTASASLAYAAVNPVLGLGALIGQWLLREPLRQASAREFHITGPWADPQVARVERDLLAPLPAAAAAADAPVVNAATAAAAAASAAASAASAAASRP